MNDTISKDVAEILQRARRVETRVWKMCEKLGISDQVTVPVLVGRDSNGTVFVSLPGYDVPLARIKRELAAQGVDPYEDRIELIIAGVSAGWIQFKQE